MEQTHLTFDCFFFQKQNGLKKNKDFYLVKKQKQKCLLKKKDYVSDVDEDTKTI